MHIGPTDTHAAQFRAAAFDADAASALSRDMPRRGSWPTCTHFDASHFRSAGPRPICSSSSRREGWPIAESGTEATEVPISAVSPSFHTILFARGRQIYSLSRAGYFPQFLSITHPRHKTPYVALLAGSAVALAIMFALWFGMGAEKGAAVIQGMLLNMAVAGAMLSYLLQAVSFLVLRARLPDPRATSIARRSGLRAPSSPSSSRPSRWSISRSIRCSCRACWASARGSLWESPGSALVGRRRLVLSPEEAFAMKAHGKAQGR